MALVDEVVERIESFLDRDVRDLLDAVERAEAALSSAESGPGEQAFEFGALLTLDPEVDDVRTDKLRLAWTAVKGDLLAHMETERRLVLPGVRHVMKGMSALRVGLRTPIRQMIAEHSELHGKLATVVEEAILVPSTHAAFTVVFDEWTQHVHVQESVIFPEVIEEDTDEFEAIDWQTLEPAEPAFSVEGEPEATGGPTPAPPCETPPPAPSPRCTEPDADDIGDRLRAAAARKAMASAPEQEPAGVLGKFRALWARK